MSIIEPGAQASELTLVLLEVVLSRLDISHTTATDQLEFAYDFLIIFIRLISIRRVFIHYWGVQIIIRGDTAFSSFDFSLELFSLAGVYVHHWLTVVFNNCVLIGCCICSSEQVFHFGEERSRTTLILRFLLIRRLISQSSCIFNLICEVWLHCLIPFVMRVLHRPASLFQWGIVELQTGVFIRNDGLRPSPLSTLLFDEVSITWLVGYNLV